MLWKMGEKVEERKMKKKVMVVIEESQASYDCFVWALDNLSELVFSYEYSLVIFISVPPPIYANSIAASLGHARLYNPIFAAADFVNAVQVQEQKVAMGLLGKAKSICTSRGINAETIAEVGGTKEAICSAVEKHNISLLVLAEEHLGKIKGSLKWSVSDYCVHYAKCPVLVVKKPE